MNQSISAILLSLIAISSTVVAFAPISHVHNQSTTSLQMSSSNENMNRRDTFAKLIGATAVAAVASTTLSPTTTYALDMDAFINSTLEADTKDCDPKKDPKCIKEMSSDEGTCKYAQGKAKTEACRRLREAGKEVPKASQGKSLGGAYAM